jgi:hypothetical protein
MPNPGTESAVVDRAADPGAGDQRPVATIALLLEGKVAPELTVIARLMSKRAPDV